MFRLRRNSPRKLGFLESLWSRPAGREILCFHKDQEGRRNSPVGCCVVGNPIQGFPDAASHAAFVQLAICQPVFRYAEAAPVARRRPAENLVSGISLPLPHSCSCSRSRCGSPWAGKTRRPGSSSCGTGHRGCRWPGSCIPCSACRSRIPAPASGRCG